MNSSSKHQALEANRVRRTFPLIAACVAALLSAFAGNTIAFAETTLVRVTPEEYKRSIHQIFGSSIKVGDNNIQPGFRDEGLLAVGERKLTITSAELEQYQRLAESIADQVVEPRRREMLLPCKPTAEDAPDEACAREFLTQVGLHLFRRPLTDVETEAFVAAHTEAAEALDSFNSGLSMALARMLIDPEFLFRVESSEPDPSSPGTLKLDAFSMASRLSFFLWDSSPDDALLAAAESGELLTQAGLEKQVERMLASPRMEDGVRTFFTDMLGFDKFATLSIDTTRYPKFTQRVEVDAKEQTLRTIVDHLLHKDGDYRDLFTTPDTFLTPALAALYGVPLPRSQELGGAVPWVPYTFSEDDPYAGILAQVSFLSLNSHPARTSPTLRGMALREKLLCQRVPPPPGEVDFNLVQDTENPEFKTVRQRLTAHSADPVCAGCHKITDRIGLSLEQFDTAGGFRTTENGAPIDASGNFNSTDFEGLKELNEILKNDPALTSCLVNRAFAYGTASHPDADQKKWLREVQSTLAESGVKWRDLMRQIALSPDFYTFKVGEGSLSASAEE
jgi:hypothetical protein